MMKHYFQLMRVKHYIKNLLVFAALICSGQFLKLDKLDAGMKGFVFFCMASSAIYIVNDLKDKGKDCLHPTKCKRPIAAGLVSEKIASLIAVILILVSIIGNGITLGKTAVLLTVLYVVLNIGYSYGLKNVPIMDITILVAGFLIRIVYGAFVTNITISNWLYLTVIVLSFYFALGKRRNELKQLGKETRKVLKLYPLDFLDKSMNMCLTLANAFYALWSMDERTISLYRNNYLILTVPLVLLITLRYSLDIEGDSDGDPVEVLFRDKVLLFLSILYVVIMLGILYL